MGDADLISLYSGRILELAANIPLTGRLAAPDGQAKRRSPICGSTISVELTLKDGHIADYAQEVRACALGQASAAIFAASVIGRSPDEISAARDAVSAMLKEAGDPPAAPFDLYNILIPARGFGNRHASILLVLDATLDAARQAAGQATAPGP